MSIKKITCVGCPMGCQLSVRLEDGKVASIDGAECARGKTYASQECVCPTRMVTSLVTVEGRRAPLSVKTSRPVPKELIAECLESLHRLRVTAPVASGAVLLANVCGTGADIVATSSVPA